MKLLLDENLSPRVARRLQQAGHDVAHVTEVGLGNTDDAEILDHTSIPDSVLEDVRIWGIQPQRLPDVDRVVTRFPQLLHDHRGHARIDQEPHPTGRSGSSRSRTASAA